MEAYYVHFEVDLNPYITGSKTFSVDGAPSASAIFHGTPRPKEIPNISFYQVVTSKQFNNGLF
jgi:hypothetical protein